MDIKKAADMAQSDSETVSKSSSIGYAINLVMDYGAGRQVTISGTLPLGATLQDFNRELDKLRLATNRQQAFVIMRDRQARLKAEQKMAQSVEHMIVEYEKGIEAEMKRVKEDANSTHKTGVLRTQVVQQLDNFRTQAANWKQSKQQELMQHQSEIGICEAIVSSMEKEIAEIDGA